MSWQRELSRVRRKERSRRSRPHPSGSIGPGKISGPLSFDYVSEGPRLSRRRDPPQHDRSGCNRPSASPPLGRNATSTNPVRPGSIYISKSHECSTWNIAGRISKSPVAHQKLFHVEQKISTRSPGKPLTLHRKTNVPHVLHSPSHFCTAHLHCHRPRLPIPFSLRR